MTDYSKLPPHMVQTAREYIDGGIRGGAFFHALVCNDLRMAVLFADDINREALPAWIMFLTNEAPTECFGSPARVKAWVNRGGLVGWDQA